MDHNYLDTPSSNHQQTNFTHLQSRINRIRFLAIVLLTLAVGLTTAVVATKHSTDTRSQAADNSQPCYIYSFRHQDSTNWNDTILYRAQLQNPSSTQTQIGSTFTDYAFESMAINPQTGNIYTVSGWDRLGQSHLYRIDPDNGTILNDYGPLTFSDTQSNTPVAVGLAFRPTDQSLWAWIKNQGIYTIDTTAQTATQVFPSSKSNIGDITWSSDGQTLFVTQGSETDSRLFAYTPATNSFQDPFSSTFSSGGTDTLTTSPQGQLITTDYQADNNILYLDYFDPATNTPISQTTEFENPADWYDYYSAIDLSPSCYQPTSSPNPSTSPVPNDQTTLTIYAAGTPATDPDTNELIYPTMNLSINGQIVATYENIQGDHNNRNFQQFTYNTPQILDPNTDTVRIYFTNDYYNPEDQTDRDIYLDKIDIQNPDTSLITLETEAPTTYSTSAWNNSQGCLPGGYYQTEQMRCAAYGAYIEFLSDQPIPSPSPTNYSCNQIKIYQDFGKNSSPRYTLLSPSQISDLQPGDSLVFEVSASGNPQTARVAVNHTIIGQSSTPLPQNQFPFTAGNFLITNYLYSEPINSVKAEILP